MKKTVDSIQLRMYRIGTGDCFTLKFLKGTEVSFTMMIDCGSCKGDSERFLRFVKQISDDFDQKIDLLVITHEHQDHIIGFARAKAEFDNMEIGQVWVGWTEDPTNALAKTLKTKYGKNVKALKETITKLNGMLSDEEFKNKYANEFNKDKLLGAKENFKVNLKESLSLYEDLTVGASGLSEMGLAMEYVLKGLTKKSGQSPFYCYPGKPVPALPGTEGIRFYVVGPPENEKALKTEEIKSDVYDRKIALSDNLGFNMAFESNDDENDLPFLNCFAMDSTSAKQAYKANFDQPDNRYRNIDSDWLNFAGSLAIRLEKYINNTSLVLAIEFIESGKVLLFPGDAQSGNWESWHDPSLKWNVVNDGKQLTVTATDLLKRTVFYKVGHHLSHNGTASKSGLDQMESPDLISVATLDYNNINSMWKKTMPSPGVLSTLIRKAKGRVFRIDEGLLNTTEALAERNKMSKIEKKEFQDCFKVTDDYIQITIKV